MCLLDCLALDLQELDVFAAERLPSPPLQPGQGPGGKAHHPDPSTCSSSSSSSSSSDLLFPSYAVRRRGGNMLKESCRLKLKVERNLDK